MAWSCPGRVFPVWCTGRYGTFPPGSSAIRAAVSSPVQGLDRLRGRSGGGTVGVVHSWEPSSGSVRVSINAKAVVRVIIEGEWIWVERGTFTVMPFEFVDDDGNQVGNAKEPAYFFISTNGDPYFGPLNKISLMKLDTQLLAETEAVPEQARRMLALGPASSDEAPEYEGDFGDDGGARPKKEKPKVALFVGDADDDEPDEAPERHPADDLFVTSGTEEDEPAPTRRSGLF